LKETEYKFLKNLEISERLHKNKFLTNISLIYEYLQVIPLTTVECERSFSKMNIIKTDLRNCLEPSTLTPGSEIWKLNRQIQANLF
jgi:hypothetical protein